MKKLLFGLAAIVFLCSHDMYLKLDHYFLTAHSPAIIQLFNGTFDTSDNTIATNRMLDVSLVGHGQRKAVPKTQWRTKDSVTVLDFTTGKAGTWVAGVSTAPRNIAMEAADFNDYLAHDGVIDMLAWRKENGALQDNAVEKYAKHVKTIFQVGEQLTQDWGTVLGYPIEFIPLANPYDLHPGHHLKIRLELQGKPLANQWVYVGHKPNDSHTHGQNHDHGHSHDHGAGADHQHTGNQKLQTDANGVISLNIDQAGVWYVRTIHMAHSKEEGLTHQSNWATLSFAIGDGHAHSHHQEGDHQHGADGIPGYVFALGSIVLIFVLYLWFSRKK